MMGRQTDLEEALYARITGHAQAGTMLPGGLWRIRIPASSPYPAMTFQLVNAVPDYALDDLTSVAYRYRLSVYDEGESAEGAEAILEWVHGLLQDQPLALPGGRENDYIRWAQRPQDTMLADEAGVEYQVKVDEWAIVVQEA